MSDEPRVVASHRATTSSRTPGHVNKGTVMRFAAGLIRCADCGGKHLDYVAPGLHGLHWRAGRLVNCVGREVTP